MSNIVYLNRRYINFKDAKIHIEDRGFQFADSIYEVISIYKNKLIDFNFHIKRLKFSLSEINIKYKVNNKKLLYIFYKLIRLNKIQSGIIYLQISRGVQSRDHAYKNKLIPTVVIYTKKKKFNLPDKKFIGKKAITTKDLRWKRRDIKSVSLLPNILAKKNAEIQGAYEAILIDQGYVTEGTSSNIWIVIGKKLITHPLNTDILKGVTRQSIKKLIFKEKITLKEKKFTKKELFKADEVFVTSSTSFVTPIVKIDNKYIKNGEVGKITKILASLYFENIQ